LELEDDMYPRVDRRGTLPEEDMAAGLSTVEEGEDEDWPELPSEEATDSEIWRMSPVAIPRSRSNSNGSQGAGEQSTSGMDMETPEAAGDVSSEDGLELAMPSVRRRRRVTGPFPFANDQEMLPEGSGFYKGKGKAVD
jgi:hypothetical protein